MRLGQGYQARDQYREKASCKSQDRMLEGFLEPSDFANSQGREEQILNMAVSLDTGIFIFSFLTYQLKSFGFLLALPHLKILIASEEINNIV